MGLPFQMYVFPEGIFIIDAVEQHKNLIGSRVISFEGVPAEDALRRVNETQSVDGKNQNPTNGVFWLHSIPYLQGLGIAKPGKSVEVIVQKPKQSRRTITEEASPLRESVKLMPLAGVETPLAKIGPPRPASA